jgi:flavin reductase (DIM6/NTAB) family NADH-FMN oxidoreductase RutF
MDFDPSVLSQADRYKLMIGGIVPRPIAWVSTVSPAGRVNLAPFSFFCGVGSDPMTMLFCPANKPDGSDKDSLRNASPAGEGGTGEFVVNIVGDALAKAMAYTATPLPHGESEFDMAEVKGLGVTPAPARRVRPPRVAESPISYECVTLQVIRTNPGVPAGGNIVLGQVVHIHAADGLVNERFHVDAARLDAVGRMGGLSYCRTRDRFDLPMGRPAGHASGG